MSNTYNLIGTPNEDGTITEYGNTAPKSEMDAGDITFDNTGTGMSATNVQGAISEINSKTTDLNANLVDKVLSGDKPSEAIGVGQYFKDKNGDLRISNKNISVTDDVDNFNSTIINNILNKIGLQQIVDTWSSYSENTKVVPATGYGLYILHALHTGGVYVFCLARNDVIKDIFTSTGYTKPTVTYSNGNLSITETTNSGCSLYLLLPY